MARPDGEREASLDPGSTHPPVLVFAFRVVCVRLVLHRGHEPNGLISALPLGIWRSWTIDVASTEAFPTVNVAFGKFFVVPAMSACTCARAAALVDRDMTLLLMELGWPTSRIRKRTANNRRDRCRFLDRPEFPRIRPGEPSHDRMARSPRASKRYARSSEGDARHPNG